MCNGFYTIKSLSGLYSTLLSQNGIYVDKNLKMSELPLRQKENIFAVAKQKQKIQTHKIDRENEQ